MSNAETDSNDDASTDPAEGVSPIKEPKGHNSTRVTPPKAVRDAVGMEADEPWSWYFHPDTGWFWLRRSGMTLEGIPDDALSVGVAEARQNGRYLDYAIPPSAVNTAGLAKGQRYRFRAMGDDTIAMIPESDEDDE